jgi:leucyl aminopeptidase (aminopeptidase T)
MGRKEQIQERINTLQKQLVAINRIPEDRFSIGTVLRFSANSNNIKWHIVKTAEESWVKVESIQTTATLEDWILNATESNVGYFEVYELKVQPQPLYTSS